MRAALEVRDVRAVAAERPTYFCEGQPPVISDLSDARADRAVISHAPMMRNTHKKAIEFGETLSSRLRVFLNSWAPQGDDRP